MNEFRDLEKSNFERREFESVQGDQQAAADATDVAQKRGTSSWGKSSL